MPRPCCRRHVGCAPDAIYFKPTGVPLHRLEEVVLPLDELAALRLADLNGQYQEQAAEQMKISRATFARIIEVACQKVADALINGKALRIESSPVVINGDNPRPAELSNNCEPVDLQRQTLKRPTSLRSQLRQVHRADILSFWQQPGSRHVAHSFKQNQFRGDGGRTHAKSKPSIAE